MDWRRKFGSGAFVALCGAVLAAVLLLFSVALLWMIVDLIAPASF